MRKSNKQRFSNPILQKHFEEHGDCVAVPKTSLLLFSDGVMVESSEQGIGPLIEPGDDYERAILVAQYHEAKATEAEDKFIQFRNYLHGNGVCPAGISSPRQKLDHLKKLRAKANTARMKYRQARKEVKETMPFWLRARNKEEARSRQRNEDFLAEVDQIEL